MGITKKRLTEEQIREVCEHAFPKQQMLTAEELTEGMCNAAYDIGFVDGTHCILKIAPENNLGLMTNEKNLMEAEVCAMKRLAGHPVLVVPEVLFYDNSGTILKSPYFFMSKMEGQNWFGMGSSLTEQEKERLSEETGVWQRELAKIGGAHFGMLGDERTFDALYDFVCYLIENVLDDIQRREIPIGVSGQEILNCLHRDSKHFADVKSSSLVHFDMWEGNIFVKDGHLCGVIDWERAMWGEPYMDDRFRHHCINEAFLRGYQKEVFTQDEQIRMLWYDVYLYLTMMAEVTYREYEDDGQFRWVKPLFDRVWESLQK